LKALKTDRIAAIGDITEKNMKISGAIFDLDGTLLDSMSVWKTLASRFLKSHGIVPEDHLDVKLQNFSMSQAIEYLQNHYNVQESFDAILSELNRMIETDFLRYVTLKHGVISMLSQMRRLGIQMCIATANDRKITEMVLEKHGIADYFCDVITCSAVGSGKSDVLIYQRALEILGTPKEETLVFEDTFFAVQTLKRHGFFVAAVYDPSSESLKNEIIKIADFFLLSFDEWKKILD